MATSQAAASGHAGRWRFGTVEVDERAGEVAVGGQRVDLDRSGFDVLLALLRHAGEIVSKDELLDAGWPGRVVTENSLAKAVSRLRRALGRVIWPFDVTLAATSMRELLTSYIL